MAEETNINMFSTDVVPLLTSPVTYVPVTIAGGIDSEHSHWESVDDGTLNIPGEATDPSSTPSIPHNVLQIVNFSQNADIPNVTETYEVLHSGEEIMAIPGHPSIGGEEFTTDSEIISLSHISSSHHVDATTDITQSLQAGSPSADTAAFLDGVISKPLKVFQEVTAILSGELLEAIPGSQSALLENIQTDFGVQLLSGQTEHGLTEIHISGDLPSLTKVQQRLETVCGIIPENPDEEIPGWTDTSEEPIRGDNSPKPKFEDKAVLCDILVPTVSQRGRVIKQHAKYTDYLRMQPWLEAGDLEDEPVERKRKKAHGNKNHQSHTANSVRKTAKETSDTKSVTKAIKSEDIKTVEKPTHMETTDDLGSHSTGPVVETPTDVKNDPETNSQPESEVILGTKAKTKKDYERLAPFKFFCKKCSFRTKRQSHFINHKRLHEKQLELHRCKKCNFSSLRLSHLRRHEATHSSQMFTCNQCSYHTDQPKLLQRHKKSKHNPQKNEAQNTTLLSCPSCKYSTTRQFHYQRHLRTHPELLETSGGDKPDAPKTYQCEDCEYSTQRKECLYRHKGNVHSDKRPYLCDLCGKSFKRPDALVQHKVTHVDKALRNYPFKCHSCRKSFRSQAHLNEHMDSHSTQRTHLCYICGIAFKTRSVQRKHMQTIHLNPGAFQCNQCQKRFNTKFALKRHIKTHAVDFGTDTVSPICDPNDVITTEVTSAAEHIQVQDVIVPSVNEVYEQTGETIQQAFIPGTDGSSAYLYLRGFQPFSDSG